MPRTIPYINKSSLFKKIGDIEISSAVRHLDRIQISVKKNSGMWWKIFNEFKEQFDRKRPIKKKLKNGKKQHIENFRFKGLRLAMIRYDKPYYFAIAIFDPDDHVQEKVLSILKRNNCQWTLSQVEFAVDFYAADRSNLGLLRHFLTSAALLKNSRGSFCKVHWRKRTSSFTVYQGRDGNVRKGSKGLRQYIPPKKRDRFRMELQTNRGFLRANGFDTPRLPIKATDIDIFNYIVFRKADERSISKLLDVCSKKKWSGYWKMPYEKIAMGAYIMDGQILKEFRKNRYLSSEFNWFDIELVPIGVLVSIVKKIKKEYGFTNHLHEFFPKDEQIMSDIKKCLEQENIRAA